MPNTEKIHLLVKEYDAFTEFLLDLDDEQHHHELMSAVEGVGREVRESYGDTMILTDLEIGWTRILWEAHHEDSINEEIEGLV